MIQSLPRNERKQSVVSTWKLGVRRVLYCRKIITSFLKHKRFTCRCPVNLSVEIGRDITDSYLKTLCFGRQMARKGT
jgi:hypothetical protein